jgi:hypothetical protein
MVGLSGNPDPMSGADNIVVVICERFSRKLFLCLYKYYSPQHSNVANYERDSLFRERISPVDAFCKTLQRKPEKKNPIHSPPLNPRLSR